MSFISAAQKELLTARLLPVLQPIDGGASAALFAQAVCDWFENDVLPQLLVLPGIPTAGGPSNQVTVGPGQVK